MQIWRCHCWQNTRQLFQIWHTAEGLLVEIMTMLSASSQFLPLHWSQKSYYTIKHFQCYYYYFAVFGNDVWNIVTDIGCRAIVQQRKRPQKFDLASLANVNGLSSPCLSCPNKDLVFFFKKYNLSNIDLG